MGLNDAGTMSRAANPRAKPKVGIDLAPIELAHRAAGTARLVAEQARALAALEVPWDWVPLALSRENPLLSAFSTEEVEFGGQQKTSLRSSFWTGPAWRRRGCALGFCTNGLVPFGGLPVVANFFDANIYEFGHTWIRTGRLTGLLILRLLARVTVQRSRRLFILSQYGRDKMASIFPRHAHKFEVTPGGVTALTPPSPTPPPWARSLDRPFFLNVGVFSDNKNQSRVLEAWQAWQREDPAAPALVFLGLGDPHYLETVVRPLVARLSQPGLVLIPGRVSDAELSWAYAHALGYLQPSFAEGFGLPIVEAMTAGCPVACSRSTSLPETAGDAAIYFDPAQPTEILQAARRLAGDAALRERLAVAGRDRAARFTWPENAAAVARGIESTLIELGRLPARNGAERLASPARR